VKYTPKELKENVNVSHTSPIKEFFLLLGGVLAFLVVIYVILGFCVDLIAPLLSEETERTLGRPFEKIYAGAEKNEDSQKLWVLLKGLEEVMPEKRMAFKVHLLKNTAVNAVALPGGNIVIYTGLREEVDSDEEIAFVLAHELGHFANRDHLKSLGRGLLLYSFLAITMGSDSSLTNFIGQSLTGVHMKFSQHQETMADKYALDLMNRRYGQVAGAIEFMQKIAAKEKRGHLAYYFSTHPHPETRLNSMENEIRVKGYIMGSEEKRASIY
jgi:Zn-dependent protease with chaperone function